MAIYILLALLIVPLLEIAVFIEVGGAIGLMPTLAVVVLTAILGTAFLRQQGFSTLRRAKASLERNEMPVAEIFDGACLLVAGALLLTPGFVTDAAGGLLFIPALRAWLRRFLMRRLLSTARVRADAGGPESGGGVRGTVIEGEYVEVAEADQDEAEPPPRADGDRLRRS